MLAIGAALMSNAAAGTLRRLTPYLPRLSGALLIIAGAYVGWYGWYELRVYAGETADDPFVSAASDIQSQLAAWVDDMGPGVFAASLALLITAALAARLVARRRAVRPRALAPADPSE